MQSLYELSVDQNVESESKKASGNKKSKAVFAVAPSPLNTVKLELGIILLGAVAVLLFLIGWQAVWWLELSLIAVYGFMAMLWIILRVKRVMRHELQRAQQNSSQVNQQQINQQQNNG